MPGTKFMKQSDLITEPNRCFDTQLSSAYADVFAGKTTTADLSALPYTQGLFLEMPTSGTPNFGSGEIHGYKIGLYVNSISGQDLPQIGIWKARKGITDNVGSFGTEIIKDIYSMTSFISDSSTSKIWETDFGGGTKQGSYVSHGYFTRTIGTGPYAYPQECWDEWSGRSASSHDFESFKSTYGTNRGDGTTVIFLYEKMDPVEGDNSEAVYRIAHNLQNGNSVMDGVASAYAEYHWYVKDKMGNPLDFTNDPAWNGGNTINGDDNAELAVYYEYEVTERITQTGSNTVPMPIDTTKISGIDKTHANDQVVGYLVGSTDTVQPLFKSGWFWEEGELYSGTKAIRADLFGYPDIQPTKGDLPEINADYFGTMQAAAFHKADILPGIDTTKESEQNSSEANGSSTSNKVRQKICINIKVKNMSEIVSKDSGSTGASFPSRGMAIWFKNRYASDYNNGQERYTWNLAEDIEKHHYNGDSSDFESVEVGLEGTDNVPFCGFIFYKYNGSFYIKSIGKQAGAAGFMWTEADDTRSFLPTNTGGQFPHFNFDPNALGSTYGQIQLSESPINKWIQLQMTFNPRGSGFDLNVMNKDSGSTMCQTVNCWSSQAASDCNVTTSWNHMSVACYGSTSRGTTVSTHTYPGEAGNMNFRPMFTCLDAPATDSEQFQPDNSKTHTEIIFDSAFITKGGSNYKHINSTFTGDKLVSGKLGIGHRTAVDNSYAIVTGDAHRTIEDSTGLTPATFWSFGTKNKADIAPSIDGVAKYLYFSGFTPSSFDGTAIDGIASKYMKWAWTTDTSRLGMQLWGKDNAGSTTDDGNLGASMFTHGGGSGQNRIYFDSVSLADDSTTNERLTSLLSCEYFTQPGHVAYATEDVSDADSMHSTIAKRENIFCSGRVISTPKPDETTVDDMAFLRDKVDTNEEYIMFIHGARNAPTNKISRNLRLKTVKSSLTGDGTIEWNQKICYSDAYRILIDTPLGSDTIMNVDTDEKINWSSAGAVKLSDGTVVLLKDYFNVGDIIKVDVSGSTKEVELNNHTIVEIADTYLKIGTTIGVTHTLSAGTVSITKLANNRDFNVNTDSQAADLRYDDAQRVFVSPNRYWLMAEIFNYDYDSAISTPVKLPDKTYNSVVLTDLKPVDSSELGATDFSDDYMGATWNEWKITDGYPPQRPWNMTRDANVNQNLVTDHDFGHGSYTPHDTSGTGQEDPKAGMGGYVSKHVPVLTLEGNPRTNVMDITSISTHKELAPKESLYLWLNILNVGSDTSVNVSTFENATTENRPFLLTVYHDERPDPPILRVNPYEKDPFLVEYEWDADGDDLWYGMLFIDTKNIASQYHNSLWSLPLNEDLTGYDKNNFNKIIKMYGAKQTKTLLYDYYSTTAAKVKFNGDRISGVSGNVVVNASAKTITIAGYGDLTDTFSSTQFIDIIGMTESGNNLTNIEISGLTSTVITVSSATTLVNETRDGGFVTVGNVSTKKISFTTPGVDLTTIFKADDKIAVHHATDNSIVTGFGVEYTIATVAAAYVTVDEQLTTNATHTSSLTIKNQSTPPDDRYDGLAGNNKLFIGTNENVLSFKGDSNVKLMTQPGLDKFSVSCHIVGSDITLDGTDYILYQRATDLSGSVDYNYYIAVNAQGNIEVSIQGYTGSADTDSATTLTSASIIPNDGETPMHICFTLDNSLPAQNLKLYINGALEASSGMANDSGDNGTSNWTRDLKIAGNANYLFVGAENQSGDNGFSGSIEEVVAYADCIYPVNPKESKYLHTVPLEDFQGTGNSIAPQSYTARLFVKDYHNIRGSSASEVATSSLISFRKPVFDLRGA